MRRHLRIWWAFVKNCLAREMSFRLNFFLTLLTGSWWFLMSVFMFAVVFSHVNEIAGWTKYEVFFLLGVSHVILRLFGTLFMNNLMQLPQAITTGTLDFYLIKPVHPQFLVSTRYASFEDLADTLIGFAMMTYAGWHLPIKASPADLAAFVLLAVNGVVLYYAIMFISVTVSFWFMRFHMMDIWWQMTGIARNPAEIFRGKLLFVFTYCIPMLVIVNFPVKAYLHRLPWHQGLWGLVASGGLLAFSSWFFGFALRRYRSASS